MTARLTAATSWRPVDIRPTLGADGSVAVAVRFSADGEVYALSLDTAEDAAWRLLEAAKLARAGISCDDPERAN